MFIASGACEDSHKIQKYRGLSNSRFSPIQFTYCFSFLIFETIEVWLLPPDVPQQVWSFREVFLKCLIICLEIRLFLT